MKILVTGANGQLGTDVLAELNKRNIEHKGVDIDDFDITDLNSVLACLQEYKPDTIIHCAAYTAVDNAEDETELCMKINKDGTENIAIACNAIDAEMIYISTDYVFDGAGNEPFETNAQCAPLQVYGKSKLAGENAVLQYLEKYYIVRISWVFGKHGNNFVKTMLRLAETRDELSVVSDQVGSPTYTPDLAVLLCSMAQSKKYGIYHATNEGYCSWAEFAEEIMKTGGNSCIITPITTKQYPTKATRPKNSRLSKTSLDNAGFTRLPTWQNALERYFEMNTGKWSPLVSIVIPVYNGSNYLREALDSALAQTYENLEILVVNDGSNDGGATEQIALSYGDKIRYFYKENGGTSTALNLGIENMRGEYFSWLSHDDLYYPQKISRAIEELSKLDDKDTIIISDYDVMNEDYTKIFSTASCQEHRDEYPKRNDFRLYPVIYNKTHGCTHLFSKNVFETVGLFDVKKLIAHDFEFYYRAFSAFPHLYIDEVLVTARDSSNRQGKRSRTLSNIEYSLLYIKMIEQLSGDDILQIAPSVEAFVLDMEQLFSYADYSIALEYIEVLAESKGIKTVLGRRDTTNIPTQHNPYVSANIEAPHKASRYNLPVRFIRGLKRHGLRKFLRLFIARLKQKLKKTNKT